MGPRDLRALRKDGTELPVEIALSRVDSPGGVHVTAVIRDITDRKRMERELEEERAQRNQRIEILARLSSGLAHEIKNPLAIIHARASDLAEMASEGEVDRAQIEKTCASIVQTSDRAIRILRGIAAIAGAGRHDPIQPASASEIVDQALDLLRGRFAASGILLTADVPPGLPMLECRQVEIGQVLVNLLNNAFDAVDGDARSERWVRVQVSTRSGADYEDQVGRLQIDVVDGGPGVAAEHRNRLMQTFFTTKAVGAGIGIGLSVSQAIAKGHGGQLELSECEGHTCFRLTLPFRVEERKVTA
jgi:C4-dicarboxylate-specific signal transduction histidine kinase